MEIITLISQYREDKQPGKKWTKTGQTPEGIVLYFFFFFCVFFSFLVLGIDPWGLYTELQPQFFLPFFLSYLVTHSLPCLLIHNFETRSHYISQAGLKTLPFCIKIYPLPLSMYLSIYLSIYHLSTCLFIILRQGLAQAGLELLPQSPRVLKWKLCSPFPAWVFAHACHKTDAKLMQEEYCLIWNAWVQMCFKFGIFPQILEYLHTYNKITWRWEV